MWQWHTPAHSRTDVGRVHGNVPRSSRALPLNEGPWIRELTDFRCINRRRIIKFGGQMEGHETNNSSEMLTLDDVYGISRGVPRNYVQRSQTDHELYVALGRKRHIVIYGSSKQGKTCLRKQSIRDDQCIRVTCSNNWTLGQLHAAILKAAGYTIEQSTTKTSSGEHKLNLKLSGRANPIGIGIGIDGGGETTDAYQTETVETRLELDPSDVNDVIEALDQLDFDRYLILEDFHYLNASTQREFSVALKAFYEDSPCIVVVIGVWLDQNRLVQFNGDLTGRLTTIDADHWSRQQLKEVIEQGEGLLNIKFCDSFVQRLLDECCSSVWIVQEVCYRAGEMSGILGRQDHRVQIGTNEDASRLIEAVVNSQSARYHQFIRAFTDGAESDRATAHRWLLAAVLVSEPHILESGLHRDELYQFITANAESEVSIYTIDSILKELTTFQLSVIQTTPIIFDYDRSGLRLNVTDRGFIIWLNYQDKEVLLNDAGMSSKFIARFSPQVRSRLNKHYRGDI
jgi:hypothetical protein